MKVARLYGPSLPILTWISYLTMHAAGVSIVRESELQALEQEVALLHERLKATNEARQFWHNEYMRVASSIPEWTKARVSSHGSSSPS